MARSWNPVRRGRVYCAPACGCGCTYAEYRQAVKDAAAAARELGEGWEAVVHENLGWHAAAKHVAGWLRVTVNRIGNRPMFYTAFLSHTKNTDGGAWIHDSRSPRAAVAGVLRKAGACVTKYSKALEEC